MHLATEVEEAPLSIEGFGAQKVSNDCKNKAFDFLAYNSQIGDGSLVKSQIFALFLFCLLMTFQYLQCDLNLVLGTLNTLFET